MSLAQAKDAAKEPTVSTLRSLLGHKIEDEAIQTFVDEQRLSKIAKGDSGSYSRISDETGTFSLLFRGNVISRVIVKLMPTKGVSSSFKGVLPFQVLRSDTPKDIRKRLAKPQYDTISKDGDGWLVYQLNGSRVIFAFMNNKMYEIDLDAPETK